MSFVKYRGKTKVMWMPIAASVALVKGTLIEYTSGTVAAADADEVTAEIGGVLGKTTATTDADYATARSVPIIVPVERHVEWVADATGTFAASDIGEEFGISDSGTVDHAETTADAFLMTGFISASKIVGCLKINGTY